MRLNRFILMIFFLSLCCSITNATENTNKVKISAKQASLSDVISEVYDQTGFHIDISSNWEDFLVNGEYIDVEIEQFLSRIFRGRNVSIISDLENKVYYIRLFGEKLGYTQSTQNRNFSESHETLVVELGELHAEQRKELEDYLSDPNAVDPLSGMMITDINDLYHTQRNEIEEIRKSEMSDELIQMHQMQRKEIEDIYGTDNAKDPLSQMTMVEIKKRYNHQKKELEVALNNPNTVVDKETGMTISELKAMHEKQRLEFNQ